MSSLINSVVSFILNLMSLGSEINLFKNKDKIDFCEIQPLVTQPHVMSILRNAHVAASNLGVKGPDHDS